MSLAGGYVQEACAGAGEMRLLCTGIPLLYRDYYLEAAAKQSLRDCIVGGLSTSCPTNTPLPLGGSEDRADVMGMLLFLSDVVGEVCRVPDHHVPVANVLPIDEAVDSSRSIRL